MVKGGASGLPHLLDLSVVVVASLILLFMVSQ